MQLLVLASTSPYRRRLMDQLAVPYVAAAPPEEEDHQLDLPTDDFVRELARRKAESLGVCYVQDRVVGINTVGKTVSSVSLASGRELKAEAVVNVAGAWAAEMEAQGWHGVCASDHLWVMGHRGCDFLTGCCCWG